MVFAFAFAVELFPPFAEEVEFGAVVDENFDFLACAVERVASGCIGESGGIGAVNGSFAHFCSTVYKRVDVEAGYSYGEQTHGGEYGEAAAYVVGDDVCLVDLGVG